MAHPMSRDELLAALKTRRNNDIYVHVPMETGGDLRVTLQSVRYDPVHDVIELVTEEYPDGLDGDA